MYETFWFVALCGHVFTHVSEKSTASFFCEEEKECSWFLRNASTYSHECKVPMTIYNSNFLGYAIRTNNDEISITRTNILTDSMFSLHALWNILREIKFKIIKRKKSWGTWKSEICQNTRNTKRIKVANDHVFLSAWRMVMKMRATKRMRQANTGKQANKDDWRELSFSRSYTKMHTNKSSNTTVKQICNWKTKTMTFFSPGILEDTFSWPGLKISRKNVSLSGVSGSNWRSSEMTCGVSRTCYTQCHAET